MRYLLDTGPLFVFIRVRTSGLSHTAIVLRFFEGKDLKEIGAALGVSPNAAKTRVSRALEKLRRFFAHRGIAVSAATLAGVLSAHSVQGAPVGLAATVTAAAVKGTSVTASTLTLIKTTLKIMTYSSPIPDIPTSATTSK